jgi:RNA polymerase sigma-70 factor (ECF subfamily)
LLRGNAPASIDFRGGEADFLGQRIGVGVGMCYTTETGSSVAEWQRHLDAARAGSVVELGILLSSFRSYLLCVANRELTGDVRAKLAPSDVVQDTFLQAQRKIADFKGGTESELLAWLRSILFNKIQLAQRTYHRTQARDVRRERSLDDSQAGAVIHATLVATTETPSRYAVAHEQVDTIETMLSRLPADYQTVLRLRYWEQLPLAEVARKMNRTPDAVQKLWFRAIERMKRELARAGT